MPLISMRQLLDHAAEHGYGLPAFNVNNMEQIRAIMEAAAATDSPVILQGSVGARKYAGDIPPPSRRSRGRNLAEHPHRRAPGPRCHPVRVHQRHPPRLHLGDDGRLAPRRRQNPRRLRL